MHSSCLAPAALGALLLVALPASAAGLPPAVTIDLPGGEQLSGTVKCSKPSSAVCIVDSQGYEHIVPWAVLTPAEQKQMTAYGPGRRFRVGESSPALPARSAVTDTRVRGLTYGLYYRDQIGLSKSQATGSGLMLNYTIGAHLEYWLSRPALGKSQGGAIRAYLGARVGARLLGDAKTTHSLGGGYSYVTSDNYSNYFFAPVLQAGYQYNFWSELDRVHVVQPGIGIEVAGSVVEEIRTKVSNGAGGGLVGRLHWMKRTVDGRYSDLALGIGFQYSGGGFHDYFVGFSASN